MPTLINLICPICNKPFQKTLQYVNKKKKEGIVSFKCSPKCNMIALMKFNNSSFSIKTYCKNCNMEINRNPSELKKNKNHFCSRSCATSYRNKHRKRTCKYCGKKYLYDKDTCTKQSCPICKKNREKNYKNLTIKDYINRISVRNKHQSYKYHQIRQFVKTWNSHRPKVCQYCGYKLHIEYCHIKHISTFSEDTLLSVVNDPSNILILCPNHHWEFDNGYLIIGPKGLEPLTSKLRVSCSTD